MRGSKESLCYSWLRRGRIIDPHYKALPARAIDCFVGASSCCWRCKKLFETIAASKIKPLITQCHLPHAASAVEMHVRSTISPRPIQHPWLESEPEPADDVLLCFVSGSIHSSHSPTLINHAHLHTYSHAHVIIHSHALMQSLLHNSRISCKYTAVGRLSLAAMHP